jgi:hypothetical protein
MKMYANVQLHVDPVVDEHVAGLESLGEESHAMPGTNQGTRDGI